MGEYIQLRGQQVKIGTCEDLSYINYPTLVKLFKAGRVKEEAHNDSLKNYLTSGVYRFRFPWPDEDHQELYDGYEYNRTLTINVDQTILGDCECGHQHDQLSIKMQKPLTGQLWAVVESPCGRLFRIDIDDAFKVSNYVLDRTTDPFVRKVMFRMQAGYINPLF